jgi:hypothetical protein
VLVEHAESADRTLRRDVDVPAVKRGGADEEERLFGDPLPLHLVDRVIDLAHATTVAVAPQEKAKVPKPNSFV